MVGSARGVKRPAAAVIPLVYFGDFQFSKLVFGSLGKANASEIINWFHGSTVSPALDCIIVWCSDKSC